MESAAALSRKAEKSKMKKDITICFRTSSDIRNYLAYIARQQRQSLSYVIESLIYGHQQGHSTQKTTDLDRRQYKRKKVLLQAFIGHAPSPTLEFETGTVLDICLGGIRFSVPKKAASKIWAEDHAAEYNVTFTLPDQSQPIRVKCQPQSILNATEEIQIGAAIVDADFSGYQSLQKYLI
jgi:hypothetical protein